VVLPVCFASSHVGVATTILGKLEVAAFLESGIEDVGSSLAAAFYFS
jgi:hypothetical protein